MMSTWACFAFIFVSIACVGIGFPPPDLIGWLLWLLAAVAVPLASGAACLWGLPRDRFAWRADEGVWIATLFRRMWIPVDAIQRIDERHYTRNDVWVTLHLDRETPFGSSISFSASNWSACDAEDLADEVGADYLLTFRTPKTRLNTLPDYRAFPT